MNISVNISLKILFWPLYIVYYFDVLHNIYKAPALLSWVGGKGVTGAIRVS